MNLSTDLPKYLEPSKLLVELFSGEGSETSLFPKDLVFTTIFDIQYSSSMTTAIYSDLSADNDELLKLFSLLDEHSRKPIVDIGLISWILLIIYRICIAQPRPTGDGKKMVSPSSSLQHVFSFTANSYLPGISVGQFQMYEI